MNYLNKIFFLFFMLMSVTCLQTHNMHAMEIEKQKSNINTIINSYTVKGATVGAIVASVANIIVCETGLGHRISDVYKNINENSPSYQQTFKRIADNWAALETKYGLKYSKTKTRNAFIKIVIILAAALICGTAGYVIKDIKDCIEKARLEKVRLEEEKKENAEPLYIKMMNKFNAETLVTFMKKSAQTTQNDELLNYLNDEKINIELKALHIKKEIIQGVIKGTFAGVQKDGSVTYKSTMDLFIKGIVFNHNKCLDEYVSRMAEHIQAPKDLTKNKLLNILNKKNFVDLGIEFQ